jgi:hypothetical protein
VRDQCPGRGQRVRPARADPDQPVIGLDDVAGAGHDQRVIAIGHREHRLQAPQHPVRAPVLGQLHRGPRQVAAVLLELGLEAFEERESIGSGAREAGEHPVAVHLADLARARLDHGLADRHLPVARDGHLPAMADGQHRGGVEL